MRWQWSEKSVLAIALGLCAILFAFGWVTRENPAAEPLIQIVGGGFVVNYREAEMFYGFTAHVMRPIPSGSIIEASFENPAGGRPHTVSVRVSARTTKYALRSPPLQKVEADKPYRVTVRAYDRQHKEVLWEDERSYTSQVSDQRVPQQPLTVGPGYHRNPRAPESHRAMRR